MSAAIEVRRLFPGITDNAEARESQPLPAAACQITRLRLRRGRARPTKPVISPLVARQDGQDALLATAASRKAHGRPSRWPSVTETLLEDAARARRLAIVLDGDPAAPEPERYAEEVEAEILRRAAEDLGQ
jgi:hypothetical protein